MRIWQACDQPTNQDYVSTGYVAVYNIGAFTDSWESALDVATNLPQRWLGIPQELEVLTHQINIGFLVMHV